MIKFVNNDKDYDCYSADSGQLPNNMAMTYSTDHHCALM